MSKNKLLYTILTVTLLSSPISHAVECEHGISLGYAHNSDLLIKGKHLNLYNPVDSDSWRVEQTETSGAEISDTYTLGFRYKNNFDLPVTFELGVSYTYGKFEAQNIGLVSQEGSFSIRSDQPKADARFFELYAGTIYKFDSGKKYTPYIGAGLSYFKGKAYRTFYSTQDLLAGIDSYGKSGSSDMDGFGASVKAGIRYEKVSVELEYGEYDGVIDAFRSFQIDGADIDFERIMLSAVYHI